MPLYCRIHALVFQPTLPRGERRSSLFIVFYSKDNFNPRSREGSDKYSRVSPTVYSISTHAPARGATIIDRFCATCVPISTHAPARGATIDTAVTSEDVVNFNPRSREGSDVIRSRTCAVQTDISTHAPARGAT